MSRHLAVGDSERRVLMARHPEIFAPPVRRLLLLLGLPLLLATLAGYSVWRLDFSVARLGTGLAHLIQFLRLMIPPSPGPHAGIFLHALVETLAIAFLGTLAAATLAFPFAFLAARNVIPNLFVHVLARRFLDVIRGIDVLIWALVFINVVGLGPFAGVLAIAVSDFATFGKLFSEAFEGITRGETEGVVAAGGGRLAVIRFAMLPQILPVIASQVLYYFESNTRSATIIGIVGAGGVGLHIAEQIRVLDWDRAAFLILLVLMTVAIIDAISTRLRLAMTGRATIAA
jgi:phosphonate transport system permease protein